ncbi:MAG: iron-regulated protein [Polyangiaceae bacterium]|nr:iron-regulated protein [Polyangiaceae bacterium]
MLVGCGDSDSDSNGGGGSGAAGGGTTTKLTDADIQPVIDNYAKNVHANYAQVLTKVQGLQTAVDELVQNPSNTSMGAAKDAWMAARPEYLQTEAYRFYGGPIDDEATGPEGLINGWPLDENYIDYVDGSPMAGIINDPVNYPTISKDTIAEANEAEGEKALSAGYHAVEFLLWGQDQSTTGPGARPFSDYVTGGGGTALNQDRRGLYIREASGLLVDDIQIVVDAWVPGQGYAKTFVEAPPRDSLGKMMTGIASLAGAELSTERMNNAYETQDQEEEHSCFSDTTHVDHLNDIIGIENVYFGKFGTSDGPGIDELVEKVDPTLNAKIKADIAAARAAIEAMPVPFDQAIIDNPPGSRAKVKTAIDSLYTLAESLVQAGSKLEVTLLLE